jgi:hypothetical protein
MTESEASALMVENNLKKLFIRKPLSNNDIAYHNPTATKNK